MRNRLPVLGRAILLGLAYGAGSGALFALGLLLATFHVRDEFGNQLQVPAEALIGAAFLGGLFGSVSGLVFGFIGGHCRGPLGWGLAGALGGLAAALLFADALKGNVIASSAPSVIGALVGLGIGFGLRASRSPLPGVSGLAATIRQADEREQQATKDPGRAAELTPSDAPAGRGDEPTP